MMLSASAFDALIIREIAANGVVVKAAGVKAN